MSRYGMGWVLLGWSVCVLAQSDKVTDPAASTLIEVPADADASAPALRAAPAKQARTSNRFIEEIIITAQKREENLQDVPISVQAFGGELLDARGISDSKDLPLITPGLTITSEAGFAITYLRGVGSDAFVMGDPSVATYIDGVYFPFQHGLAQDFGAVERIEVLKGPQGTLFGRNAVGGAISVITKSPDFEQPETSVQTSFGNFDDFRSRVHTNIPLGERMALSVSALYNNSDHFMTGTVAGEPLPQEVSRAARIKFRFMPVDSLDITLTGLRLEQQGLSTLFALNQEPRFIARLATVQPQTGYDGALDFPSYFHLTNTVVYGQGVLNTDWFDIKLIGSDQYVETNAGYDFDGSDRKLVAFEPRKQIGDVQTAELQLISNDSSWGSSWLKWIVGGYFFKSRQGYDEIVLHLLSLDLTDGTPGSIGLPPVLASYLLDTLDPLGLSLPTGNVLLQGLVDTTSSAVFAQTTINFNDWLALTLGGRFQSEERSVVASNSNFLFSDGSSARLLDFNTGDLSNTIGSFKPKVSLDFRPFDGTLAYASWQKAAKSSAYNTVNIYDGVDYVKPEQMTAYEVGVKTTLFDGLMSLNSAIFQYDIKNQQTQFVSLLAGGAIRFENAGGVRVRGADFDASVVLFPDSIDGLALVAGGAYVDAIYTDYENGSGFNPDFFDVFTSNNDYTGKQVVRSPKFTGTLGLNKAWQLDGGVLEIAGNVYHNSGYKYAPIDDDISKQDAYTLVDAHVSYLFEAERLRVTLFGKNLTDKKYDNGIFNTDFGRIGSLAPPVTYGLRINWEF